MDEEGGTRESNVSGMQDSEDNLGSDKHRHQSQSSDDDGWDVNSVARGQDLSDYRPLDQPVLTAEPESSSTQADSGPVPHPRPLQKHIPQDVRVVSGDKQWCGLQNMGNTCYMNAGLQCLCSVPQFASYFLKSVEALEGHTVTSEDSPSNGRMRCRAQLRMSFVVLVKKLWCGQFSSLHPKAFKLMLGLVHPPFTGSRQQDCQEFLAVLLDHLHEQLIYEQMSSGSLTAAPSESIVSRTFQGQLKNEVECLKCGHVSVKLEPFVYLSLPLPGAHERQIEVSMVPAVWDTSTHFKVIRMLVTLLKEDSISELKKAVCALLERPIHNDLLVIAEVKQGHVARLLGDAIAIKQLTFSKGEKIYCYEMLHLSELTSQVYTPDPWSSSTGTTQPQATGENCDAFGSQPFVSDSVSTTEATDSQSGSNKVEAIVMEWRTCSICLEEMLDSDLMIHPECGGVVCNTCLQSSVQHFSTENKQMPCPICSVYVLPSEAFCSLSSRSHPSLPDQPKCISFLQVVLLMRGKEGKLFGHPQIIHLPQEAHGALYYKTTSYLLPPSLANLQWSLCLTDAQARYCSRCSYESFCSGCPLQRSTGSQVKLKPGDHVTVSFAEPFTTDQLAQANEVCDHKSFLNRRDSSSLTLNECLDAFSNSEELAEDNPWFCSVCNRQQRAKRTLRVESIPPLLIVHLKRFMYHSGGHSSKLEMPVEYPSQLSAQDVCPSSNAETTPLKLVGLVCHYGTLQGGHYTAYVRKPVTGSWMYCNDSCVSELSPSSKEAESAYILFYQHQADPVSSECDSEPFLNSVECKFDDEAEIKRVQQLMLSSNVQVSTPTSLKRTNSDPDMKKDKLSFKVNKRQCNMSPF